MTPARTPPSPPARTSTKFEIRWSRTAAEREAIARLRYDVYVVEMGRVQPCADHAARTIHEPLDEHGLVLGAYLRDGTAIGTLRLNAASDPALTCGEFYGWSERERSAPGQVFLASKLIVAPGCRGQLLALELMRKAYHSALERRWRHAFLDANDHLVALYTRLGFRPRNRVDHALYGTVTVMEWDLLDVEHLRACRSPMLRDALEFLDRGVQAA